MPVLSSLMRQRPGIVPRSRGALVTDDSARTAVRDQILSKANIRLHCVWASPRLSRVILNKIRKVRLRMRSKGVANPICNKCGRRVSVNAGGFIGRADLEGKPDMLFVVYCRRCGNQANVLAREHGTAGLTPLSEVQEPFRHSRPRPRTRHAAG
jgi:hypothetical protein